MFCAMFFYKNRSLAKSTSFPPLSFRVKRPKSAFVFWIAATHHLGLKTLCRDEVVIVGEWFRRHGNWNRLSEFFRYSKSIRKLIYTTNTVEGYHRQIRKVTKNKGVFPNDTALIKLVYLAYRNARKKWTMPVPNWGIISQQLAIKFEDRYNLL